MKTQTRVFETPKLRAKKFLGVPVPILALLLVSGLAAAAGLLGPVFGPKTSQVQIVTLSYNAAAGSDVAPAIVFDTVDLIALDAANSGSTTISGVFVVVTIAFGDSCTALQTKIADSTGALGKIEFQLNPAAGFTSVSIPTVGGSSCVINSPASTGLLASGSTVNYFQMKYKWEAAPTTNPGSWSFQASN